MSEVEGKPMTNGLEAKREQLTLRPLSDDFLVLPASVVAQSDAETARTLQAQENGCFYPRATRTTQPVLSVTLGQANLVKNYGLTRMDPYCKMRIGHKHCETRTCPSGSKNPHWNQTFNAHVPPGIDSIHVEIYDERTFAGDSRIAWALIKIPEPVLTKGETVDDWYPLNGEQGEGKEGMINIIWSYRRGNAIAAYPNVYGHPGVVYGPGYGIPTALPYGAVYPHQGQFPVAPAGQVIVPGGQQPTPNNAGPLYTDADVKQLRDMFPNIEEAVIRSVLDANAGNKTNSINSLLQMTPE